MGNSNVKKDALKLVEELTDDATWDDLMYKIYVRQSIEAGIADSKAGKALDVNDVRRNFGLDN